MSPNQSMSMDEAQATEPSTMASVQTWPMSHFSGLLLGVTLSSVRAGGGGAG